MARSIFTPFAFSTGGNTITNDAAATVPLVIRGVSGQTANLQEWQNSASSTLLRISANGSLASGGNIAVGSTGITNSNQFQVTATSATNIGAVIRGAASQTADLLQVQNSSGTVLGKWDQNGFAVFGASGVLANALISSAPYGASQAGIAVKMAANATADVLQIQNSSSTIIGGRNANAQIYSGTTAPLTTAVGGATTGASGTGTTATITLTSAPNVAVGDRITVAGVTPTGYNGTFIVTAVSNVATFSVSYANATTGAQTVAGTVVVDAQASITARSAGTTALIVKASASQTNPLTNWVDSSNNVLMQVTSTGGLSGSDSLTAIRFSTARNVQLASNTSSHGGGQGVIGIGNAAAVPTSNPTGGGILYVDTGALKYRGTSGAAATIVNADGTMAAGGSFTGGTLTSNLTLAAGTTSLSPLTFQTGANLTTVTAGANEYDGTVFYSTSSTTPGRALNVQNYAYVSSADYIVDFTGSGAVQSILGATTRGITVAAGTTYEYELSMAVQHQFVIETGITGSYQLTSTTVTGTPTVAHVSYVDYGSNTTAFTTATTMSSVRTTGNVTFSATISSGSRYNIVRVKGLIRVTGTGTAKIYPGLLTSATNQNTWTVMSGLNFRMTPIGNGTVTSVGTWA